MSARPARRLRVARSADATAPSGSAPAPVQLVSAFSAAGRVARAEGLAGGGVIGHELRLPGIGGRYLAGVAAHAHARGWDALEVAALLAAVEERSAMWVVAPSAGTLRRAGLIEAGRGPRRACARWSGGRWARVTVDPAALSAVAAAGGARAVCAAAVSGARAPHRLVSAVQADGVRVGALERGLAASLGVAWTVELLVAPAPPAGSLMALRDRVAGAPRCGWCGVPVLGPACRRCLSGSRA
jgi:hypothetical protein